MVNKTQNYPPESPKLSFGGHGNAKLKDILSRYGIKPVKGFGQHFLVGQKVLTDFLEAAELSPEDIILEIGSGTGVITVELAHRVKRVVAVEKDRKLIPILDRVLQEAEIRQKVEILNKDALKLQVTSCRLSAVFKVLGAIPYQITSPLLHKFLKLEVPPELIVLIIQNKVAEKVVAMPPRATYLSNFVRSLAEVELVGSPISSAAFWPRPKVESRIIKLRPPARRAMRSIAGRQSSKLKTKDEIDKWEVFLHRGFRHPRKMLRKGFEGELLEIAGINPRSRPQELMLEQWKRLYSLLCPVNNN